MNAAVRKKRVTLGYIIAILGPIITTALRVYIGSILPPGSFTLFVAVAMLSSWLGGFFPGVITTVLTVLLGLQFYLPPENSLAIVDLDIGLQVLIFVIVSFSVSALNHAFRKANDAALELVEAKSRFLANISHEIRTPLAGIIGLSTLLKESILGTEEQDYVNMIHGSAESLLKMLNNVLEYSKGELARLEIRQYEFDLIELLHSCNSLMKPLAEQKNIQLISEHNCHGSEKVSSDPIRIRQILTNLISNAVKFTEFGTVTIRLKKMIVGDTKVVYRFEIEDTGIGVSPKDKNKLFKSFSQADTSFSRRYDGTGLGLVISKRLVELMGGEIGYSSVLGKGSLFWFTIPVDRDQILPVSDQVKSLSKILVVDDHPVTRMLALKNLESIGYKADAAASGREAIEMVQRNPYQLVLLDCHMPVMDGFETALMIKDRVPVVAMTADLTESCQKRCRSVGMRGFISKPIVPSQLKQVVDQHLA